MNIVATRNPTRSNLVIPAIVALLLLLAAGFAYYSLAKPVPVSPSRTDISLGMLEEKYGLRVNLIAVTAAGGFVDLRIKIVDGDKAKALLSDKQNFPALWVNDKQILNAPEDTRKQQIKFDDDGVMFIMYMNPANAVRPGTPVKVLFGDVAVEAIDAK